MIKALKKLIAIMILTTGSAQAELVYYNAIGNGSGISTSEMYSGTLIAVGSFDNTGYTGVGHEVFDSTFTIDADLVTFTSSASTVNTEIVFEDGYFYGVNYSGPGTSATTDSYYLSSTSDTWAIDYAPFDNDFGEGFQVAYGSWNDNAYSVVPVPAAIWLFGSGLIGLIGFSRRNNEK